MSNPMKSFASIEQLALHGQQVDGGFIVNGRLPWVSNLGVGHVFGTAFRIEPGHHGSGRELMALIRCDWPGLTMSEVPSFLAMDGTGTYGLEFVDVFVPDEYILADPIGPWLKRIRNGFVLMQVGIGTGHRLRGADGQHPQRQASRAGELTGPLSSQQNVRRRLEHLACRAHWTGDALQGADRAGSVAGAVHDRGVHFDHARGVGGRATPRDEETTVLHFRSGDLHCVAVPQFSGSGFP
jgi:alkylation response protein AidB-like acyl-CoA dehydrogenase